jgi:N-acetylglucosamine kinase-like BadF-type ATPase
VLAVDGGNSKTDVALLDAGGGLLSVVRGAGSSPQHLGIDGCLAVLQPLIERAAARAAIGLLGGPIAAAGYVLLAGADLPEERVVLSSRIAGKGWSERLVVDTDTVALLRTGTDRGWGVAVVCGAGINCIGRAPDGTEVRFLALGPTTGDWGGGADVGLAALGAAARSADRRGPQTPLEHAVAAHFGVSDPDDVARAIHLRELSEFRLVELAPLVLAASDDDPVAAGIIDRLTDEIVAFAVATLRRLNLTDADSDVVLGGGIARALAPGLVDGIAHRIHEVAPDARVAVSPSHPIVGAALLGLDTLGADAGVTGRARASLDEAIATLAAADPIGAAT